MLAGESNALLERAAADIPTMGGLKIGRRLRQLVQDAPEGTAIVEVGAWLGSGTAQLALGNLDRGPGRSLPIYVYDRFEANESEVEKAAKAGVHLQPGEDTLPRVKATLDQFGSSVRFVKGDVGNASWEGTPISVYVDDAAKAASRFRAVMRTFGPSFIPGKTAIILMDYYMWDKPGGDPKHRFQTDLIEAYPNSFKSMGFREGSIAGFVYAGGFDFATL